MTLCEKHKTDCCKAEEKLTKHKISVEQKQ